MDVTLLFFKNSEKDYACAVAEDTGKCGFIGYGITARQAEEDFATERDEYLAMGENPPELRVVARQFDLGSLFSYFPLNATAFAKMAGINASQLRQYVSGQRKPSKKTLGRIEAAVRMLGQELMAEGHTLRAD